MMSSVPQLLPNLAPTGDDARTALELLGFWRMFGGGGWCMLRWDVARQVWYGMVEDAPEGPVRHVPDRCLFSPGRLADFARMADCQLLAPYHWILRYREPR